MDACQNPDFLRVVLFLKSLLGVLFIAVPIGIIIMVMVDFFKNVSASSGGDTSKNLKLAIKRIVYCIIIFLVPFIVKFINNTLVNFHLAIGYTTCIENSEIAYIEKREIEIADEALAKAEKELTTKAVAEAKSAIDKISNADVKKVRETKLEEIRKKVTAKEKEDSGSSNQTNPDSSTTNELTTGYLTSPLNPNATHDEYIKSIGSNSKSLYYIDTKRGYHGGTDLPVIKGTKVYAMDGGTVFKVQDGCGNYGRHIILEHTINGKKYYTIYAHLSKIEDKFKNLNTSVKQGELIALSGDTYRCTGQTTVGAHLHIGISYNSNGSFPQTEGDKSFLISNFMGTGASYSIVDDSNLSTYKKIK